MAGKVVIMVEIDTDELVASQGVIQGALAKTGTKGGVVFTELRKQQQQAAQASQLFSQQLGVQLPRALQQVLARSRVVGPALAAMFNVTIVAGFALILVQLVGRMREVTDKIVDWDGRLKRLNESVQETNKFLLEHSDRLKQLRNEYELIGLKGAGKFSVQLRQQQAEVDKAAGSVKGLEERVRRLREQIEFPPELKGIAEVEKIAKQAGKTLDETVIPALTKAQTELKLAEQALANLRRQFGAEALEEARKAAEAMEKLAEANRQFWFEAGIKAREALEKQTADFLIYARAAGLSADAIARLATVMRVELEPAASIAADVLKRQKERLEALRQAVETARSIEEQVAIDRARLEGRTMDAIILEEKKRTRETIEELKKIGLAEEDLKDVRIALEKEAQVKIAEENKRRVEQMAGTWDNFIDRVVFGAESWKDFFKGMLREMLATFLKFVGRMIIAWITGLEKMKDIWEAFKKSLPGGGINISIGIGGTAPTFPGFAHGGLVDDVLRRSQAIHSTDGRLLAMLHQGEAVLNPGAVARLGAGRINALNAAGRNAPSFQGGGLVGTPAGGPAVNVTVNVFPAPGMSAEQVANFTIRKFKRELRDQGLRLGS